MGSAEVSHGGKADRRRGAPALLGRRAGVRAAAARYGDSSLDDRTDNTGTVVLVVLDRSRFLPCDRESVTPSTPPRLCGGASPGRAWSLGAWTMISAPMAMLLGLVTVRLAA